MFVDEYQDCCGACNISGLWDAGGDFGSIAQQVLRKDASQTDNEWNGKNYAIGIFVDWDRKFPKCGGRKLAEFIKKHRLGKVTESELSENPIHPGHMLRTWVWNVNAKALTNWCKKNDVRLYDRSY